MWRASANIEEEKTYVKYFYGYSIWAAPAQYNHYPCLQSDIILLPTTTVTKMIIIPSNWTHIICDIESIDNRKTTKPMETHEPPVSRDANGSGQLQVCSRSETGCEAYAVNSESISWHSAICMDSFVAIEFNRFIAFSSWALFPLLVPFVAPLARARNWCGGSTIFIIRFCKW